MEFSADMVSTTVEMITGALGGAGGAALITRFFFLRFVRENDKKHERTARTLEAISKSLSDIVREIAVSKTVLDNYEKVQVKMERDHDRLIQLTTTVETLKTQFRVFTREEGLQQ